uniref:Uncharacterized protein n=1 Tax=Clastoptera arizonana TaxID=38151 RepID=A0A1B6BYJ7_9HEMI
MMVKKRRLGNSTSPSSSRIRLESNISDVDDVMLARDRLKGALEEVMISVYDSESSHEDTNLPPLIPVKSPPLIKKEVKVATRRRKRKDRDLDMDFHHTYVMKLYDRSVDLAQFSESTPLYPICRAWMANNPRASYNTVQQRSPTPEITNEVEDFSNSTDKINLESNCDYIKDIYKLPQPSMTGVKIRIPPTEPIELQEFILSTENEVPPMKENLLRDHLERWSQIRKKWLAAASENESRYAESGRILTAIYKRAQKSYL